MVILCCSGNALQCVSFPKFTVHCRVWTPDVLVLGYWTTVYVIYKFHSVTVLFFPSSCERFLNFEFMVQTLQRQNKMICLFKSTLIWCLLCARHYSKHFTTWTHLIQGCFENKCTHPHFIDEVIEAQWDHKAIPGSLNPEFWDVYHRKNETWESTLLTNKLFFFFRLLYSYLVLILRDRWLDIIAVRV